MLPRDLFNLKPEFCKELGIKPDFNAGCRVLVIVGQNAAGKSFLRRWIQSRLREDKVEVIALSHELRTREGMHRAFIYGDEHSQSTGAISAHTFIAGVRTIKSRENPHVVIWDEPEIGMGEELQIGTANWLCEQLNDWPEHTTGVILLSHSRHFVRRAMQFPKAKWYSMDGYATADEWLNRELVPVGPKEVQDMGNDRWSRVNKILKTPKK